MKQLSIEITAGGRLRIINCCGGDLDIPNLIKPWLDRLTEPGDHIYILTNHKPQLPTQAELVLGRTLADDMERQIGKAKALGQECLYLERILAAVRNLVTK